MVKPESLRPNAHCQKGSPNHNPIRLCLEDNGTCGVLPTRDHVARDSSGLKLLHRRAPVEVHHSIPRHTFLGSEEDLTVGTCQPEDERQSTNIVDWCYLLAGQPYPGRQRCRTVS